MKTLIKVFVFLLAIVFSGCSSLEPVAYVFDQYGADTSSITFKNGNPSVLLVFYNNNGLPEPENNTYWDPIVFPSNKPLDMVVHASYQQQSNAGASGGLLLSLISAAASSVITSSRAVETDVVFNCPPLESGHNYQLVFRKEAGIPGVNKLVLTDSATKKVFYEQKFEIN